MSTATTPVSQLILDALRAASHGLSFTELSAKMPPTVRPFEIRLEVTKLLDKQAAILLPDNKVKAKN